MVLMDNSNGKGVVVIASRDGLLSTVVGDRGDIPWPGPCGNGW